MCMYLWNKIYDLLKHINIIFKYYKSQEHSHLGAPNLLSFFCGIIVLEIRHLECILCKYMSWVVD
jgi:hypothetical protein